MLCNKNKTEGTKNLETRSETEENTHGSETKRNRKENKEKTNEIQSPSQLQLLQQTDLSQTPRRAARAASSAQELPTTARSRKELAGASGPGTTKDCQEHPGAPRPPGTARSHEEAPGVAKNRQQPPRAAHEYPLGATRNPSELE